MYSLRSPAKINLFLRILYKRSDGYHELASLFQAIDLCDSLHFSEADRDQLTCTDPSLSCGADNSIMRALALFRKYTGWQRHLQIHLEKRIPQEAGLGGGSSNCATTLYALNELSQANIPEEQLRLWSAEISADAPFFFSTGTAYCQGIGERVTSLPPLAFLEEKKIYIFKPKEGVSTRKIFATFDFSRCDPHSPEELLYGALQGAPHFINDLESLVYQMCPALENLRKAVSLDKGDAFFMTGSGSAHVALSSRTLPMLNNEVKTFSTHPLYRSESWY